MTQAPYSYANNDPLDQIDPLGLCGHWYDVACQVGAAAGTVAGGVSSAAGAVGGAVSTAASTVASGVSSAADWTWQHKEQVGVIAGGVVLVVGGTVLTGGLLDAAALAAAAAEEEGAGAVAWETYSMATHGIFVFAPGITLIGGGLSAVGAGIYQLLNSHGHSSGEACSP